MKYAFIVVIVLYALSSCAVMKAPSGGAKDTIPPCVIKSSLQTGSRNFSGNKIVLEFNKYMNKSKAVENFFISPKAEAQFDWSGKELQIKFPNKLEANSTYYMTLGADYSDLLGNKPKSAFSLVFSTGDKLDSGEIKGKLFGDKPSGNYIWAYKIDGINPDTLDISKTPSRYMTQVGSSGDFIIPGLPYGVFRLFAIKDELKNGVYEQNQDAFSCANFDIKIDSSKNNQSVKILAGKVQNFSGSELYSAQCVDKKKAKAYFSDELDSTLISKESIIAFDSSSNVRIPISAVALSEKSSKELEIYFSDTLAKDKVYGVKLSDNSKFKDKNGRKAINKNTAYFYSKDDTNFIKQTQIKPSIKDSALNIELSPSIYFAFSVPLESYDSIKIILSDKAQKEIPINKRVISGSKLYFAPQTELASNEKYYISAEFKNLKNAYGFSIADTAVKLKFTTLDKREWGGVSGKFIDSIEPNAVHIAVFESTDKRRKYQISAKPGEDWRIELPAGEYNIFAFSDIDGNGLYCYGEPMPYKKSERFYFSPSSFKIKERMEIEGAKIVFDSK